jgi:hypothetical protein
MLALFENTAFSDQKFMSVAPAGLKYSILAELRPKVIAVI